MALRLRSAKGEDAATVASLHLASWRDACRGFLEDEFLDGPAAELIPAHWNRALSRKPLPGVVVLATVSGEAAGFIAIWRRGPVALIDNLHVRPGMRRAGIGRTLLSHAARRMCNRGCKRAELMVFSANAGAIRFYQSLGAEIGDEQAGESFGQKVTERRCSWPEIEQLITRATAT